MLATHRVGHSNSTVDPEVADQALRTCDVEAVRNLLKGLSNPKEFLHTVGDSTRLPIEVVIYSNESSAKIIETLKVLIEYGLDVNFDKPNTPHPPFSLIAIQSSPEVIKFFLEKGMKFDGKATYPAESWCNHQVAHLIHKTPEPCSANNFEQHNYPNGYDHNIAKLKLDLFNFIKEPETRKNFVRLLEKRVIVQYSAIRGENPKYELIMELPTLDDQKVSCHLQYTDRIENNGSENFNLSVKLPNSLKKPNGLLEFTAKYSVNAYDGNDTTPYTNSNGADKMSQVVKEYFGIHTDDFYGFLLLLVLHLEAGTLVTAKAHRRLVLLPRILKSVPRPTWYLQVIEDWARALVEEKEASQPRKYYED